MAAFCLAIFTGAFLLFLVQPLIARFILPWFGGTPAVWTTCMLFFQLMLLGGYAYAHWLTSRFAPRRQVVMHLALIGAALLLLPITPGNFWKPPDGAAPLGRILLLLTACIGLPYLALAATGPLMQAWFSRANPDKSPYRLYALSNVGSLLALVCYPFVMEPNLSRQAQANTWSLGLVVFALLAAWCGRIVWRRGNQPAGQLVVPASAGSEAAENSEALLPPEGGTTNQAVQGDNAPNIVAEQPSPEPPVRGRWLWFALPACGCALLLAVTNKLCYDIAVIPFLWVLPLGLYLLSFIISFDSPRWYWRPAWLPLLAVALLTALWMILGANLTTPDVTSAISWKWFGHLLGPDAGFWKPLKWLGHQAESLSLFKQIVLHLGVLFVCCMVCHGEVYRLRPPARHLTGYYLLIAAGGAGGGFFVAVIAPLLFKGYFELHVALVTAGVLAALALATDARSPFYRFRPVWAWVPVVLALVALGVGFHKDAAIAKSGAVALHRNFYGVLKVDEWNAGDPHWHKLTLQHGTTTHGLQYLEGERRNQPTSYYVPSSGVGLIMRHHPSESRRVGVVGLGTGSMAAWGRAGDHFRFYEINRAVEDFARRHFSYLKDSPAQVEVVMGDARLSLEREPVQQFDVLVLDAFSSDAIPVHLLTREAFEIYLRHLRPEGVLAVHISNKYLNLQPVVRQAAAHFNLELVLISNSEDSANEEGDDSSYDFYHSDWMLLTRSRTLLKLPEIAQAQTELATNGPALKLWTDDRSDLFRILELDNDGWLAWLRRKLL